MELARELEQLDITEHHTMITMDIKDLYVNLPKHGLIQSAAFWLDKNKSNIHREGKTQILHLLQTLIEETYFQHNTKYYKPTYGIAMDLAPWPKYSYS